MEKGEIRAIKVGKTAICEWLLETLCEHGNELFDILPAEEDDILFGMNTDEKSGTITFYALEFSEPHPIDLDGITEYLDDALQTEVDSLYKSSDDKDVKYKVFVRDY